ncbi:hypothetical protein M747DRAFT_30470 [Aspergillus niger ATCC 13496]|uniref:Uncharacterized protein n=1 Tax=Aspergillus niger ATCC 13496 TaxID=1353008 RepID=A0A370BZG5_ASPNG|nr:hypothetical protein M747DRAFT_30470 [Aspergillus niger ATCC 13496]
MRLITSTSMIPISEKLLKTSMSTILVFLLLGPYPTFSWKNVVVNVVMLHQLFSYGH